MVDALKLGKIEGVAVAGESAKSLEETSSEEGSDGSEKKKSDDVETELWGSKNANFSCLFYWV